MDENAPISIRQLSIKRDPVVYFADDQWPKEKLEKWLRGGGKFSRVDSETLKRVADAAEKIELLLSHAIAPLLRQEREHEREHNAKVAERFDVLMLTAEKRHGKCPKLVYTAMWKEFISRSRLRVPNVRRDPYYPNKLYLLPTDPRFLKDLPLNPCGPKTKTRAAYDAWIESKAKRKLRA